MTYHKMRFSHTEELPVEVSVLFHLVFFPLVHSRAVTGGIRSTSSRSDTRERERNALIGPREVLRASGTQSVPVPFSRSTDESAQRRQLRCFHPATRQLTDLSRNEDTCCDVFTVTARTRIFKHQGCRIFLQHKPTTESVYPGGVYVRVCPPAQRVYVCVCVCLTC